MTSSFLRCTAEAELPANVEAWPGGTLPGPGRQAGLIPRWEMEVKWLASEPSAGERAPSGMGSSRPLLMSEAGREGSSTVWRKGGFVCARWSAGSIIISDELCNTGISGALRGAKYIIA